MSDFETQFESDPWISRARLVITQSTDGLKLMGLIRSTEMGTVANASAVGTNRLFNAPTPGNFDKGWIRVINTTAFEAKVVKKTLASKPFQKSEARFITATGKSSVRLIRYWLRT